MLKEREIFSEDFFIFQQSKVFEYPILPEPPCLTHPDGSIRQNDKAKVSVILQNESTSVTTPSVITNAVIDGMFLVNSDSNVSPMLAGIARSIFRRALELTNHRADLCFDVYESPGIKDVKKIERGNLATELIFSFGPGQKTPSNFTEMLKLDAFKKEFLRFLVKEFENPEYAFILGEKVLYCSVDNECKKCYAVDGILKIENVEELYGYHLKLTQESCFM